jgi:hypothetical protein
MVHTVEANTKCSRCGYPAWVMWTLGPQDPLGDLGLDTVLDIRGHSVSFQPNLFID